MYFNIIAWRNLESNVKGHCLTPFNQSQIGFVILRCHVSFMPWVRSVSNCDGKVSIKNDANFICDTRHLRGYHQYWHKWSYIVNHSLKTLYSDLHSQMLDLLLITIYPFLINNLTDHTGFYAQFEIWWASLLQQQTSNPNKINHSIALLPKDSRDFSPLLPPQWELLRHQKFLLEFFNDVTLSSIYTQIYIFIY